MERVTLLLRYPSGARPGKLLLPLFRACFFDFFFQVFHVVLRYSHMDVVHEFVLRARIFTYDSPFFDEMDLKTSFLGEIEILKWVRKVLIN